MGATSTGGKRRFAFTTERLKATRPPDSGRVRYHDSKGLGLCLVVSAAGSKVFYWYGRIEGRPRQIRIGPFPKVTVAQARDAAKVHGGKTASGQNPADEIIERKQEAKLTLERAFTHWMEAHSKVRKRTWQEDKRQYDTFLAPWKSLGLRQIKRGDVVALHAKVGAKNGPYAANRMLALLRAVINRAIKDLGYNGMNPAAGVEKFPEHSRERFLGADELPRFFKSLAAEPDETFRDFFTLSLITGARKSNLLAMRWDEVDWGAQTWTIPAGKSKKAKSMTIPLVKSAMELLARRYQVHGTREYVFPSYGKTGHLLEPKGAWKRIIAAAGLEDVRPHDLRRSIGSWMTIGGASLPIVGNMLGHAAGSPATAVYGRLSVDPVRIAAEKAVLAMQAAGNGKLKVLEVEQAGKDTSSE